MTTFSANVERWRPIVAKYVPAQYVDKFLYAMQGESGGDPNALGDGGVAIGLMQIQDKRNFANRPDKEYLLDPEQNIKYAAEQLGAANGDFSAWGEGSAASGKPFGALKNGYPGDSGSGAPSATDNLRKGQEERVAQLEKLLDEGFAAEPPDSYDEVTGINPHDSWAKRMQILNTSLQNAYAALGRKDQGFAIASRPTKVSVRWAKGDKRSPAADEATPKAA